MKRRIFIWLIGLLLLSACASPQPETLTIFAASSLTDAFTEMGQVFQSQHPQVLLQFNFAASQTLRTQIEQGAQADIFAPASLDEMNRLLEADLLVAGSPQPFASNQLIVLLAEGNPANIKTLPDLTRSDIKIILAAPQVPAGKYTLESLIKMNKFFGDSFLIKVNQNVVSQEENIRQVLAKIKLGEADAGFVYLSDATSAPELNYLNIPPALNSVAIYPIGILKTSENPTLAQQFIELILSPQGQEILQKVGFSPAP